MDAPPRIALAAHRLMLRTAASPLGKLWVGAYRLAALAWAGHLGRGERGMAAYERAGAGLGEVLPGLSDVDVALVLPEDPAGPRVAEERVRERWQSVRRRVPSVDLFLDYPRIYEVPQLADAVGSSALTYGLEGEPARHAGYLTDPAPDVLRMLERPGLYGAISDWRPIRRRDLRPPEPPRERQAERAAAWLELAYCWRWAFELCTSHPGPRTATLCVRNVSEPARIWLWLAHRERAGGRADALRRAMARLPDEPGLEEALALHASLTSFPDPPPDRLLPTLVRFTERIAALIAGELEAEGVSEVRLTGADGPPMAPEGLPPGELPLCDWRALAWPRLPDESLTVTGGDPGDPAAIAEAAIGPGDWAYRGLRAGGALVLPASEGWLARMRAVQCGATDPVTFALAEGRRAAAFPEVPGWSAHDVARRAVAEHRPWVIRPDGEREAPRGQAGVAGRLLTAARAALFLDSLCAGEPSVPVTAAATAQALAERVPAAAAAVDAAFEAYRGWCGGGERPSSREAEGLSGAVSALPAYAPDA